MDSQKTLKVRFETGVINKISQCWEINKYGVNSVDYYKSDQYEQRMKLFKKPLITEEIKMDGMERLREAYENILLLCKDLKENNSKLTSMIFKTAIIMSEIFMLNDNAYNIALCAVDTAHNRSWFRAAMNRNKDKKNLTLRDEKEHLITINLEEMIEQIDAKLL